MNIFRKEYWKSALLEFRDLKKLAFAALICAVTVALAAAGAFPWLPRYLIRAIIRLGLQDGAGRALPPLA